MKLASKDIPLQEITLRRYEYPQNLSPAELAKKFLLSVGLIQPGESRDILVYIFQILLAAKQKPVSLEKFIELLKNKPGSSAVNIRRQLRRLREFKLAEKIDSGYKLSEIRRAVDKFIAPFIIEGSVERLKEYAGRLDNLSA